MKYVNLKNVVTTFLLAAHVVAQTACTSRTEIPVPAAHAPPTLEWKEGYGGGSETLSTVRKIEEICREARNLKVATLKRALQTEVDVADRICALLEPGALEIRFVNQPKVAGEPTDFANFPKANPPRLEVKREFWNSNGADSIAVEDQMLHELLPLVKIIDRNYSQSRTLSLGLHAARGSVRVPHACTSSAIYAMLSGASESDAIKFAMELGLRHCAEALEIFAAFAPVSADEVAAEYNEAVRTNLQQGFAMGVFQSLVRTKHGSPLNEEYATVMKLAVDKFRYVFRPRTDSYCAKPGARKASECDGFMAFLIGSRPDEKQEVVGFRAKTDDFDREAAMIIRHVNTSSRHFRLFYESSALVRFAGLAIRTYSWAQLAALGDVQRSYDPMRKASTQMLSKLDLNSLRLEAEQLQMSIQADEKDGRQSIICLPVLLDEFAAKIIDGEAPPCAAP